MRANICGGQKRVSDTLNLVLQGGGYKFMHHPMLLLGPELRSSARTICTLNHRVICLAPRGGGGDETSLFIQKNNESQLYRFLESII